MKIESYPMHDRRESTSNEDLGACESRIKGESGANMDDCTTASSDTEAETCMVVEIQQNEMGELMLVERPQEQVFTDNRFCVVECKIEPSEEEEEEEPSQSPTFELEDMQENIEIIYLPEYNNPNNGPLLGPILLKQELDLHENGDGDFEGPDYEGYEVVDSDRESDTPVCPPVSPKVYRRAQKRTFAQRETGSTKPANSVVSQTMRGPQLRPNPNVIVTHQGTFHPRDRTWTLKLDTKDFMQAKSISSVTTIHTKPKSHTGVKIERPVQKAPPKSRLVVSDHETSAQTISSTLPHKCKYCDRSFRQSVSLQIHSTLHRQGIPDGCHVS